VKRKFIQAYMDVAERFAQLSHANRAKVGAIIVKDNRVISIGYNGMPSGWPNDCEFQIHHHELGTTTSVSNKEVLHAEANAIAKVAKSNESCDNAAIFCTHEPCMECAKLILQCGISSVYYRHPHDSKNYGSGIEFLNKSNIYVEIVNEDSIDHGHPLRCS